MAVTHTTAVRNEIATTVLTPLNSGGVLAFRTSGTANSPGTSLVTLPLSSTAFGSPSAGVATANAITSGTASAGTVATATLQTSDSTVRVHCAVAASGSDISMGGGLTLASGDTVSCSALSYTATP